MLSFWTQFPGTLLNWIATFLEPRKITDCETQLSTLNDKATFWALAGWLKHSVATKRVQNTLVVKRQSSFLDRQEVRPQAWVDTPQLVYSAWNQAAGDINQPLGFLPRNFTIGLVGAGITNIVLAFNLAKAGAKVTLIEASHQVGGRLRSSKASDGVNVAEMGAMRFPPSQDLLYYYAEQFGFAFIKNFPDPGKVPTTIFYQGVANQWLDEDGPPSGFETVDNGWKQLIFGGLSRNGKLVIAPPAQLMEWLSSKDPVTRNLAVPEWQNYLDVFGDDSFYTGLQRIFGDQHEWDVPGGKVWNEDDFNRFGTLGIGSGGFGAVFTAGFNSVLRLVVNGLESDQAVFAKVSDEGLLPAGIHELAKHIWNAATALGVKTKLGTVAEVTSGGDGTPNGSRVSVRETSGGTSTTVQYDLVIVGTTSRAMVHAVAPVSQSTGKPILSTQVQRGIHDLHMTASSKLFIRTKKFWENQTSEFPRVILSDTNLPQTYTLDYGHPEYGMVLVTYAWEDLSLQMMAIQDPKELLRKLKEQIARLMKQTKYSDYVDYLTPVTDDDIFLIHWQLDRHSYGAFSLGHPGQDKEIASLFYDFQKLAKDASSRVLVNSDCTSFLGGWVDGGLQSAHNTLSAIFERFGSLNPVAASLAPSRLLDSTLYQY
ncbi:flavin-containing amine oxidoreductase [Colletotrichum navitas]|uniref:Flavin-containing amine oxidoreductase n=1 Tax=Colletotrichum navitas TaxID=681940 RepID=A0AAD8V7N9_9PEZI|nr:flavin-containing amine oxidoreductase [Colletotrichum navitas]KAK1594620.1 flavin-containing amine oxidoreductase [Colletotrichum navitas]